MPFVVRTILDLLALPIPDFVETSYRLLLGRSPDPSELEARASVLRTGWGRRRLLADIGQSPEFKARHDRLLLEGSDEAFVTQQYETYLRRTPDPDGLATYVGILAKGKSRAQIRRQIATSREARVVGAFWFELEHLLIDEEKEWGRFGRWFGRRKRLDRRQNQQLEITRRQSVMLGDLSREEVAAPVIRSAEHELSHGAGMTTAASLANIASASLAPDARRALARLWHFYKIAPRSESVD